jgi:hypothetical protein
MPIKRSQSEALFKAVGKLAIRWNDLELQLRRVGCSFTDDWFTVTTLIVDLQAANLIQAIKPLAAEHDVEAAKLNRFLDEARPKTGHRVRLRDMVFPHVDYLLTSADRLRLHRNLYIHCINSLVPEGHPPFVLGGMTTRATGRLSDYEFPIKLREINKVTAAIEKAILYADRVGKCIAQNIDNERRTAPKWPKPITPYPKLKKPYAAISDRMPLF